MSEYGVVTGPESLTFTRVLPGSVERVWAFLTESCLLYTSPSPRDVEESRMPSSA